MQDAMATVRTSQQKKEADSRVLAELGTNPSKAANDLYDYVISKGELPFKQQGGSACRSTRKSSSGERKHSRRA